METFKRYLFFQAMMFVFGIVGPIFLVLFFAPVYVPLSLLQGWIHDVAVVNPLTRVVEAGRGFLAAEPTQVGAAFAVAIGLVLLFGVWAVRGLRNAEAAG